MIYEDQPGERKLPWKVIIEWDYDDIGYHRFPYTAGIQDVNGNWMVRFDDDYGINQGKVAIFIVECVNKEEDKND